MGLDADLTDDSSLERIIADVTPDDFVAVAVEAFANPEDIVGLFRCSWYYRPIKGGEITNLGRGVMQETLRAAVVGRTHDPISLVAAPIAHTAGTAKRLQC